MAPVRTFLCRLMAPSRKSGRPKETRMEIVRIDTNKYNLPKDLAQGIRMEKQISRFSDIWLLGY